MRWNETSDKILELLIKYSVPSFIITCKHMEQVDNICVFEEYVLAIEKKKKSNL